MNLVMGEKIGERMQRSIAVCGDVLAIQHQIHFVAQISAQVLGASLFESHNHAYRNILSQQRGGPNTEGGDKQSYSFSDNASLL